MIKRLFVLAALCLIAAPPAVPQMLQLDDESVAVAKPADKKSAGVTPCEIWIDEAVPAKGYLLCVHGLGLHKGTYAQFGDRMSHLGWGVYAVDIRGFGEFQQMPGPVSRTVDFKGCMQDVKAALDLIHHEHPGSPVFLVGESMGGGITLQATSRYPELVNGLVCSVPGAQRYHQAADSVKVGAKLLAGPHKTMDVTKIVVERSTADADLRKRWLEDSLGRFQLSPLELMQFQNFMNDNAACARKITSTPVLMLSGLKDDLVKHQDQAKLIYDIRSTDAQQVYVDYAEHLILEEGCFHDDVIELIDVWLTEHSKHTS